MSYIIKDTTRREPSIDPLSRVLTYLILILMFITGLLMCVSHKDFYRKHKVIDLSFQKNGSHIQYYVKFKDSTHIIHTGNKAMDMHLFDELKKGKCYDFAFEHFRFEYIQDFKEVSCE